MPTYLVTGARGHIGANLIRRLLRDGASVRALARGASHNHALDGVDVERVEGDVRDYASLLAAARGCDAVFHAAARISILPSTPHGDRDLFHTNVIGTRNVLRAARQAGAGRVVVTSSIAALGRHPDDPSRPSDEDAPFAPFDERSPYAHTKAWAEHECLKAVAEGQDVVIATPTAVIGPHDYKPSRTGQVLLDFARGTLRAYIPGGFEYVAIRDVVQGHLLAMERGRVGQRYIFSTEFLTLDSLMERFEAVTGRRRPALRLPIPLMALAARVSTYALTRLAPDAPQSLTPTAVELVRSQRRVDCTKAREELGYRPTSIDQAIHDAHDDFVRRGLLPPRPAPPSAR